jgi:hypothetical protein
MRSVRSSTDHSPDAVVHSGVHTHSLTHSLARRAQWCCTVVEHWCGVRKCTHHIRRSACIAVTACSRCLPHLPQLGSAVAARCVALRCFALLCFTVRWR